jgi:hypothetical protein
MKNDDPYTFGYPNATPAGKTNGYPNNIANTQTVKTRGTGAATKGDKHTTKMG